MVSFSCINVRKEYSKKNPKFNIRLKYSFLLGSSIERDMNSATARSKTTEMQLFSFKSLYYLCKYYLPLKANS